MAREVLGVGDSANDGTGDPHRTIFQKCNLNFEELYADRVVESSAGVGDGAFSLDLTGAQLRKHVELALQGDTEVSLSGSPNVTQGSLSVTQDETGGRGLTAGANIEIVGKLNKAASSVTPFRVDPLADGSTVRLVSLLSPKEGIDSLGSLSGAETINFEHGESDQKSGTLAGNVTITLAADRKTRFLLRLKQDATGGRTVAWANADYSGLVPKVNPAASSETVFEIESDGTTHTILGERTVAQNIAELLSETTRPVHGQEFEVLGFHDANDGGGDVFRYDADSNEDVDGMVMPGTNGGVSWDSSGAFTGAAGDGRFIRVDQSHITPKRLGAKGDGVTDDTGAIQASLAFTDVRMTTGTYATSSPLTASVNGASIAADGNVTILLANAMDQCIKITGDRVKISGLEIDGDGGNIALSGELGEGIRVEGEACEIDGCYIHDLSPGSTANGISTRDSANVTTIKGCVIENAGYAGILANNGEMVVISGTTIKYTTTRVGYSYRFLNVGRVGGKVVCENSYWESDQAVETLSVIDMQSAGSDEERSVVLENLHIRHSNYTAGANDQVLKLEGVRSAKITGCTSNAEASVFVRHVPGSVGNNSIENLSLDNCRFYGGVSLGGTNAGADAERAELSNCTLLGGTTYLFASTEDADYISLDNCRISGFAQMFASGTPKGNQRVAINNTSFTYGGSTDTYLFSTSYDLKGHQVKIDNLQISEASTGLVYMGNTIEKRLEMSGSRFNEMSYDYDMLDYYAAPVGSHTGQGDGRCGTRSTAATGSTQQVAAALTGDAFPSVDGVSGVRIVNRNASNGLGGGWVYDGSKWVPLDEKFEQGRQLSSDLFKDLTLYSVTATLEAYSLANLDSPFFGDRNSGVLVPTLRYASSGPYWNILIVDSGDTVLVNKNYSASAPVVGTPQNIAIVYDGTEHHFYVDGELQTPEVGYTDTSSITFESGITRVLTKTVNNVNSDTWDGLIKDLRVFPGVALSANEVIAINEGIFGG